MQYHFALHPPFKLRSQIPGNENIQIGHFRPLLDSQTWQLWWLHNIRMLVLQFVYFQQVAAHIEWVDRAQNISRCMEFS